MSLYEVLSTAQAMDERAEKRSNKPRKVSNEEAESAEALLLEVTMNDPSVRI